MTTSYVIQSDVAINPLPSPGIWDICGYALFLRASLALVPLTSPAPAKRQDVAQEGGHEPRSHGFGCRGRTLPPAVGSSAVLVFFRL